MPTLTSPPAAAVRSGRLLSVDLLRGLDIAFMILVNDPGDSRVGFAPLEHADWNGFTPTDLVFPTFLYLVGVSLVLAYARREAEAAPQSTLASGQVSPDPALPPAAREAALTAAQDAARESASAPTKPAAAAETAALHAARTAARRDFLAHALRRTLLLFAIGVFLNGFPLFPWAHLRIYGVLQRIAVCYGVGSLLLAFTRNNTRRVAVFAGVLAFSLVGYWLMLRYVPVPGHGLPGRDIPLLDKDQNLVAWLDRLLLPGRLYEHTRDPEGLLSTLPAIGTLCLGLLTGLWLRSRHSAERKLAGLVTAGLTSLLLGGLWNLALPINKKMWTSSYVLWAGGWSLLLLALFFWLADVKRWRGPAWAPLLVFGRNAITSYVFAELLAGWCFFAHIHGVGASLFVYQHFFQNRITPAIGSLLFSLAFVAVCWVPMAVLYRRHIFLKI
ncbi:acyltransferase family protein [Acidipila sp. EB88]|uniref:acyltransferase family protein n=1 Tax=Acidipila sp. EB88 TaxID=2305226 RepID=UPI0018F29BC5|nr:DUF5009 domain-containing protein [Acidipila sp. EB88]